MQSQDNNTLCAFQAADNTPMPPKSSNGDLGGSYGNKKYNVGIYIRLSREDGNEVSYSVANQKQVLQNYVNAHEDEFEVVNNYIDDAVIIGLI